MALMSVQAITGMITPTFSTPTTSDTLTYEPGSYVHVKVGGTATTITMVLPGNAVYTGAAIADQSSGSVTSADRIFQVTRDLIDPATGFITITYSQVTGVTAGWFKTG